MDDGSGTKGMRRGGGGGGKVISGDEETSLLIISGLSYSWREAPQPELADVTKTKNVASGVSDGVLVETCVVGR